MNRLSVFFVLLLTYCLTGNAYSSPAENKSPRLSVHPKVLVVSFDGFRYDYMNETQTPNLENFMSEGVSIPWMQAQFPTKTFPNHQSMATGLYPDSHGITDNVVYDPMYNKTLSGFVDDPEFWNFSPDVLPIYIRNEQAGGERYSGCFMWSGSSTPYGANKDILPTHWRKYNGSVPWSERVDAVISWFTDEQKPINLAFLYHNEPDSQGHSSGTDDEETLRVIRETDARVGELVAKLKEAGIYESLNILIVSDHGMQTVSNETVIDTRPMADNTTFINSGGSPLKQLWPNPGVSVDDLYESFKAGAVEANQNHSLETFRVYKKNEMEFVNFSTNRRIAPLLLLANPNYVFEDITRFSDKGNAGVHGYDPRSPNMYAFFTARGPKFQINYTHLTPINNVDLVPLISEILGIPPPPNNGSLAHTQQFLRKGNNSSVGTSNTQNASLFPLVFSYLLMKTLFI